MNKALSLYNYWRAGCFCFVILFSTFFTQPSGLWSVTVCLHLVVETHSTYLQSHYSHYHIVWNTWNAEHNRNDCGCYWVHNITVTAIYLVDIWGRNDNIFCWWYLSNLNSYMPISSIQFLKNSQDLFLQLNPNFFQAFKVAFIFLKVNLCITGKN